jgi:hypothetical protein
MRTDDKLMKAVNSSDINGIIDILGLRDSKQPNMNLVDQEISDNVEAAEVSKENPNVKDSKEAKQVTYDQERVLMWLKTRKGQAEEAEMKRLEAATRNISIVKNNRFPEPALMSLGHDEKGINLKLNDEQYELTLSLENVINLVESPNKKVWLYSEDHSYEEDGETEVINDWICMIGIIYPRRGQLITYYTHQGTPATDPFGDTCYRVFNVEIKRLVSYYALFKREEFEREKLLQIRNE